VGVVGTIVSCAYSGCVWDNCKNNLNYKFSDCPTRCELFTLFYFCRQLCLFRVLTPIIRSWYSCNYSFWYWLTGSATIRSGCWVGTDSCVSYGRWVFAWLVLLVGWLAGRSVGWLVGWLFWFVVWLVAWLVGEYLLGWLVGWSVVFLVCCMIGWLVGWVSVWLVGWFGEWLISLISCFLVSNSEYVASSDKMINEW